MPINCSRNSYIMEIWKDIVGYEGLYQVSNLGNIKTLKKTTINKRGIAQSFEEKLMKMVLSNRGYLRVGLVKNRKQSLCSVHRIVAIAFILNPIKKQQVNHIDGNTQNNHVANLEWATPSENALHSIIVLGNSQAKGECDSQSKPVYQISIADGRVLAKFGSIREATRGTGIGKGNISMCANGKSKSGKGFIWSFDQSTPQEVSA